MSTGLTLMVRTDCTCMMMMKGTHWGIVRSDYGSSLTAMTTTLPFDPTQWNSLVSPLRTSGEISGRRGSRERSE
jgi:hypothetical protein